MLEKWIGPYGGVPPYDKVKVQDFVPAMEEAMSQALQDIERISASPEPPTFENTLAAMERSGQLLLRVMPLYSTWGNSMRTADFQNVEQTMAPKLSSYSDAIYQNSKLFQRIEAVHRNPEPTSTPEQKRLAELQYTKFVLRGARLNKEQKSRVAAINQELAGLMTKFSQNVLADEESQALVLEQPADLRGLPKTFIDAASAEATRRKMPGKWVIANTRSSMELFLTYAAGRELREKAFKIWTSRGDMGNASDNNQICAQILKLRTERSKLFGFKTFAHWKLADTMAKEPQATMDLMLKVWKPAVARARQEVAEMQAIADKEGGFKIQPWDYRFYSEKVRKAKYDLDFDVVKPYLQLEKVMAAMFWMAGKLYGYGFKKISGIPVFHKDVTVYEVTRRGTPAGLFYFDPFARNAKVSGAWMDCSRDQQRMDGDEVLPLVSNNSNFIPGAAGEPVFLAWDECITVFHEFGHALHGLSSNVTYPSVSGTNTTGDFVELPSQVHENFLQTKEILQFLTDKNGRPIPPDLMRKMDEAKTYGEGFATVEFLASSLVDMKMHLAEGEVKDMHAFERETLLELGMPPEIVMRHRIPHFNHIFSGESYAAGYYGYLWAQVLDQDAFEAFTETGDAFHPDVARKFFEEVLSVGNTIDPGEAYRRFRGRDAKVDALLRGRGFPLN